jgi:hypothetical protein
MVSRLQIFVLAHSIEKNFLVEVRDIEDKDKVLHATMPIALAAH